MAMLAAGYAAGNPGMQVGWKYTACHKTWRDSTATTGKSSLHGKIN